MQDLLIRGLASNGKVKSAATRGPGFSWPRSTPRAWALRGFQYPIVPLHLVPEASGRARDALDGAFAAARARTSKQPAAGAPAEGMCPESAPEAA